jgi:hypothetical protein
MNTLPILSILKFPQLLIKNPYLKNKNKIMTTLLSLLIIILNLNLMINY